MNRHVSLEKFEKWSFRKLIMFSEEKKDPNEFSNLDYRNVLGWLSGVNQTGILHENLSLSARI